MSESREGHCRDSTHLIVFRGFLLRSSELVFGRFCCSRHSGIEGEMSFEQEENL